jgi:hypothetical protein
MQLSSPPPGDYPADLLAREPAPPYEGEGAFALWHYSEDPSLATFRPHTPATNPGSPPFVWAVDTRHASTLGFSGLRLANAAGGAPVR